MGSDRTSFHAVAGRSLGKVFLDAAAAHPGRLALDAAGRTLTYAELRDLVGRIARVVADAEGEGPRLAAVLATRSWVDYAGVLGALVGGAGYVPLNAKFPEARTVHMLESSGARALVADATSLETLPSLLASLTRPVAVVLPDVDDPSALASRFPTHRFVGARALAALDPLVTAPAVDEGEIAYLMFTSGSTGAPKGVMVTHRNVLHHLDVTWARYDIAPTDRMSQTFDLTFDLSVFDIFVALGRGASLHVVPPKQQMAPSKFIVEHELTTWFSVPSVGVMLKRLRMLKPGLFPKLRLSLFCGERLPQEIAEAWQAAAPTSIVDNLYGPTEATIACTWYRWDPEKSASRCVGGGVPIGIGYEAMATAVVDDALALLPHGAKGELCVRGPMVTAGYWKDEAKTQERFVAMPWDSGPQNRWYRTGDVAYVDEHGDLVHCGRNDDQIKIKGYRVELAEIEHALREAARTDFGVVVPWPMSPDGPSGLVGFVAPSAVAERDILALLAARLPDYMVPSELVTITDIPLNANGKVDRKQLARVLETRHAEPR